MASKKTNKNSKKNRQKGSQKNQKQTNQKAVKKETNDKVPPPQKKKESKATPAKEKTANGSSMNRIFFNFIALFVAVIFIKIIFQPVDNDPDKFNVGYDWLMNKMLKGNLELIEQNPDLSTKEKYLAKGGGVDVDYLYKIKDATDSNDVLFFPPRYLLKKIGFKKIVSIAYATYFLYPRKVYYSDSASIVVPPDATKIVSFNDFGIDQNVEVPEVREQFMILKIKK